MDYLYVDEMNEMFVESVIPDKEDVTRYFDMLNRVSIYEILVFLKSREKLPEVKSINIPQFSNIDDLNGVLDIVYSTDNITFEDIGYYFYPESKIHAQWKYGENHYKTAALLGLTSWDKPYHVTDFGIEYMKIPKSERNTIRNKLILRIPIVQQILLESMDHELKPIDILTQYLALTTAKRRHSNVHVMVDLIVNSLELNQRIEIVENIKWK
jgi:hypothetical protein